MAKSVLDIVINIVKQGGGDKDTVKGLVQLKSGINELMVGFAAFAGVALAVDKVLNEVVDSQVKAAEETQKLKVLMGGSADEAGRLRIMTRDLGIEYNDLTRAMQIAEKKGIDVSIEGLGRLSDAYLALPPGQERVAMLMKDFGRSGTSMIRVMALGSQGMKDFAASVAQGNLVDDEGIRKAEEYKLAQQQLNDAWEAAKVSAGSLVVGPLTDLLNHFVDLNRAYEIVNAKGETWMYTTQGERDAAMAAAAAEREHTVSLMHLSETAQQAEDDITALDAQQKEEYGLIGDLQKAYETYGQGVAKADADMADLEGQLADARKAGYGESGKKVTELKKKIEDAKQAEKDAATAFEADSKKIVGAMLAQQLAAEGNYTAALDMQEAFGLISPKVAAMGKAMEGAIQANKDGIITNEQLAATIKMITDKSLELDDHLANMPPPGSTWTYYFNLVTRGGLPDLPGSGNYNQKQNQAILTSKSGAKVTAQTAESHAVGGPVTAGLVYKVHQDELVVPSQNGFVLSRQDAMKLAGGGGGDNSRRVIIYGPVTIVTQGSIASALEELT